MIYMQQISVVRTLCHMLALGAEHRIRLRAQAAQTRSSACRAFQPSKPTLFDVPLSPFGARIRYYIYEYGLENDVDIKSPADLGGLKSDEYMALHPAGKMPLLVLPSGQAIPESTVIQDYVLDALVPGTPPVVPDSPEKRAQAQFIVQYLDLYFGRAMVAMYKPMEVHARAEGLADINNILDDLERLCASSSGGPWLCGGDMTTADVAAFPHFVFMTFMLPRFFGWHVFAGRPALADWWGSIRQDLNVKRVIDEMLPPLQGWEEDGRWDNIGATEHVKNPEYKWTYP
eukprot:jgi/Ulvmu1/8641/UM046_0046.1